MNKFIKVTVVRRVATSPMGLVTYEKYLNVSHIVAIMQDGSYALIWVTNDPDGFKVTETAKDLIEAINESNR